MFLLVTMNITQNGSFKIFELNELHVVSSSGSMEGVWFLNHSTFSIQ